MSSSEDVRVWEEENREYLQTTYRWLEEIVYRGQEIRCYDAFVRFAYMLSEHAPTHPGIRLPPPLDMRKLHAMGPWKPVWRRLGGPQTHGSTGG